MVLDFTKMNGAGNDFVLVDNRARKVALSRDQVVRLCDRHRGAGAEHVTRVQPRASRALKFKQDLGAGGVPQGLQRLHFDLPDAFPCDSVPFSDLLQGLRLRAVQSKAASKDIVLLWV